MTMTKSKSKHGTPKHATPAADAASESIMDSAHQIWLAGLGAFAKAQSEGGKWFEALVSEGAVLETRNRQQAEAHARELRGNVESAVENMRERSLQTWDKLEKVFEGRVARALDHLDIPGHEEMAALTRQVEALTRDMRNLATKTATPKPAKPKRASR